jgi:uncharacterized NAD(P)/FAD-binding protein YdhS
MLGNIQKPHAQHLAKSSVTQDLLESDRNCSMAIIGCGASGVAALTSIIEVLEYSGNRKYKISIFEKNVSFGSGVAYQCDSEDLLMNMISSTTSVISGKELDFWEWMIDRGHSVSKDQVMSGSGVSPDGYISRQFFGRYLRSRLDASIVRAQEIGVDVDLINTEVIDIKIEGRGFKVICSTLNQCTFDYVILCIGNNQPKDVFELSGKDRYVNDPYPINRYAKHIDKKASVGIIGGQLTAADIAIVMANQGHSGPIYFLTRDSNFPLLRSSIKEFSLKHLTLDALQLLKLSNPTGISLRQLLRLARKDFFRAGIRWNKFFKMPNVSYHSWIQDLLANPCLYASWQHLAIATDSVIAEYWDAFLVKEKKLFMEKHHRAWMSRRVPLPIQTAMKLHSLFASETLKHYPNLITIKSHPNHKFIAHISNVGFGAETEFLVCDWVINATGPSRLIDDKGNSPLVGNLLKSGMIFTDPMGGVLVDFETSLVKRENHDLMHKFYAIGHLTSGTYYFVSSLDMVSLRAKRVALHIVQSAETHSMPKADEGLENSESRYVS